MWARPSISERVPFLLIALPCLAGPVLMLAKRRIGVFVSIAGWIPWSGYIGAILGSQAPLVMLWVISFPSISGWLLVKGWKRVKWS